MTVVFNVSSKHNSVANLVFLLIVNLLNAFWQTSELCRISVDNESLIGIFNLHSNRSIRQYPIIIRYIPCTDCIKYAKTTELDPM